MEFLKTIVNALIAFGPVALLVIGFLDSIGVPLVGGVDTLLLGVAIKTPHLAYLAATSATVGSARRQPVPLPRGLLWRPQVRQGGGARRQARQIPALVPSLRTAHRLHPRGDPVRPAAAQGLRDLGRRHAHARCADSSPSSCWRA